MITLIIDTSTDKSVIAFAVEGELLLNFFLPAGIHSSRGLMTTIASGFKELNISPAALRAIAVGIGPGSYTGIRVGAAAAKGLAFPHSLPLIGLCSLEGFVSEQDGLFASLIDARLGGAYVLLRQREGKNISLIEPPRLVSNEHLESYLEGYTVVGPHTRYPNPAHLAWLALQTPGSSDLELMYLRVPDYRA